MSSYVYQSRSLQKVDELEVDALPGELLEQLRDSPVLRHVVITVIHPVDDEEDYSIEVRATVDANYRDKFSGIVAFCTADEVWLDALQSCGLERTCMHSRMHARDIHQ